MPKILKYKDLLLTEEFLKSLEEKLLESNESNKGDFKNILSELSRDLKFNFYLVATFGAGIRAIYPVVEGLLKNGTLNIDLNTENVILLSLASLVIAYTEVKKDHNISKKEIKSILEELKLRGIGNGIVKKMVSCVNVIGEVVKVLFKGTGYAINGLFDMFGYTSILIPCMNAITYIVDKHKFDMDTLISNLGVTGVGVATLFAKKTFNNLYNLLRNKIKINPSIKSDISDDEIKKEKEKLIVDNTTNIFI
jgi:hypothetical protein